MADGKIGIPCEIWVRDNHITPLCEYDPSKLDPIEFQNEDIERTFTYPVPNEWRSTSFSDGKTDEHVYKGPRYLVFQFDKDTGKEIGWCLTTAQELHRPVPLNVVQVKVDCMESDEKCLLCDIGNDMGHPENADHILNREWTILHEAPDGYNHTWYTDAVRPRDIYNEFALTYDFETNQIMIPIKGWENEGRVDVTWEDVRKLRDKMLSDTDGKISDDMPQELKDKWMRYRQLLRDLPTALAEYPAFIAAKMWPTSPDYSPTPTEPQ
jgi:hypothetical protein